MTTQSKLSQIELAQFLTQLAELYASTEYGNPRLSVALRELASTLVRKKTGSGNSTKKETLGELSADRRAALKNLDVVSVKTFIEDENKTKTELLHLASAGFYATVTIEANEYWPRSTINSALLHENSIEIL